LAIAVAATWGFNFVAIHVGLAHLPPLLFSALRFGLAAFPALLFVGRPTVAWRWVLTVGLVLGVVKFTLLFEGMDLGMPAGLSSLVLQSQAIFTVIFAVLVLRERPRGMQVLGLTVAAGGLGLVAWRLGPDRPFGAFVLVLGAAVTFGAANVAMRKAAPADMLNFMVWVSAVATPPLIILTLLFDGPSADLAALRSVDLAAVGALAYIAGVSTLVGFGVWGALIRRYGASTVAPFAMLVPFFGVASGVVLLGERVHTTDLVGGALVVGGVLLGVVRRSPTNAPPLSPPVPRPTAPAVPPGSVPASSVPV
jgi:O-acetylserine/cysteine efflux transporter